MNFKIERLCKLIKFLHLIIYVRSLWYKSKAGGLILIINIGAKSHETLLKYIYEEKQEEINEGVEPLIWLS